MAWLALIVAGLAEVLGVNGMNMLARRDKRGLIVMIVGFAISFSLLKYAMLTLPMGMSYAIWTGIGTVGAALIGMIFYGESKSIARLCFIALILASVIGLKLIA
ncbi:DMT family transporter [Kurthia massiliensis]|uniref:DMT family transporter n=1 Tax=Kurthia massiliensis TaxID=1033739 RepID=UPI000289040C|nr:multidrug efflux SMR transporter [Kurthia massiliensis]